MLWDIKRKIRIYWKKIIIVLMIIVLFFTFSFLFYRTMDYPARLAFLRSNPILLKVLPVFRSVRKISDLGEFFYYFQSSDLPIYSLNINPENIKILEESLPDKVYVKAKFYADNKEYDVKVKYRGDGSLHWENIKKSYLIKFKDDELFNGIKKLSFILPYDRGFATEELNNYRAEKLDLAHPISYFSNLKINSRNNGLYFVIENWSSEMEAKWQMPDPSNFYGDAGLSAEGIWQNTSFWEKKVSDELLTYEHYSDMYKLLELVNNKDDEIFSKQIFNLVDKDNFFNWLVHQKLVYSNHQIGANVRLVFNHSLGKFYFIPWDVSFFAPQENFDSIYNELVTRVLLQPDFMYERNQRLWEYVANKDILEDDLRKYDEIISSIKIDLYKDRLKIYTNSWAKNLISERRQGLEDNFNILGTSLKQVRVFTDIHLEPQADMDMVSDKNLVAYIDLKVNNLAELFWQNIEIPTDNTDGPLEYAIYRDSGNDIFDNNDIFIANLETNENNKLSFPEDLRQLLYSNRITNNELNVIDTKLTTHRFYISSKKVYKTEQWLVDDIDLSFDNAITGKKIKKDNRTIRIINDSLFNNFNDLSRDISEFLNIHPQFRLIDNQLVLGSGTYFFNKNVILPVNYDLLIRPGTTINLAPKVSIIVHGAIIADGSKARISIQSSNKQAWGTIASLSSNKKSIFKNVWINNGSESYINGAFISAMLAVHQGDVELIDSFLSNAHGDDAFNLKWGEGLIDNNTFSNNDFDALDLDWTTNILIANNTFSNNDNDAIDIGGGEGIKIYDNTVESSGDKCISIGENAKKVTVFNNWLSNCIYGLAVKDGSEAKMINNTLVDNNIGIGVYQKKPIWGGADIKVYNSIIQGSKQLSEVDDKSSLEIFDSSIDKEKLKELTGIEIDIDVPMGVFVYED